MIVQKMNQRWTCLDCSQEKPSKIFLRHRKQSHTPRVGCERITALTTDPDHVVGKMKAPKVQLKDGVILGVTLENGDYGRCVFYGVQYDSCRTLGSMQSKDGVVNEEQCMEFKVLKHDL